MKKKAYLMVLALCAALELEERRAPGKTVEPAGIFYYRIKDPIVDREKDDHALEEKTPDIAVLMTAMRFHLSRSA